MKLVGLTLLVGTWAWAQSTIPVAAAGDAFHLDGKLDEAFWGTAAIIELQQQAPKPGEPTPFRTFVRVAANSQNLYIAFECEDPEPRQMAVHTRQRDGDVTGDDFVSVALDTYGDRRTGYFFRVNAAGARVDGLIAGPEDPSLDWDGIWDARVQQSAKGWTVEIVIPSRTLNFTRGLAAWGVNFERNVARVRTVLRWTSPTLDSFFYDLSRGGTITGLDGLEQGLGIEASPYIAGRARADFPEGSRVLQGAVGGEFTYRLTPQLAAVFTANTDFAETEVDTRQLNLTRFELFFPERRAFFLEGSNQYQFGLGLDEQFLPFFSRRIGLFEGEQIPINAGLKLNGRAGKWNIGFLDVQTRDKVLRSGEVLRGTNLLASRVSYDVTPKLRVGTIVTNGNPDGVHRNTLTGFDAVYRTSEFLRNKNLFIGAWTAFASGDVGPGNRAGYGFKIDYPNDRWDCFFSFNKYGEALDPALGFIPRPGIHRTDWACEFKPRPRRDGPFGWIRQHFMDHRFYRVTNFRGLVESQRFEWTPLNMQLESGDQISFGWTPWRENLPVPFEIADGVVLPVGRYRFDRLFGAFVSSPNRRVQFGNESQFGSFYGGRLYQQSNDLSYTSREAAWQAGLTLEQNFGRLPQGSFVQRLWQFRTVYAFNAYLSLSSFLQYDSVTRNAGNNMRLRWTVKPGNDFFVVWNRGWKRLLLSPQDVLAPDTELLAVKLRWTFRP
ncbi:MAG: DUF5916 domain-containing protein [Acidobacteriota bacterium]